MPTRPDEILDTLAGVLNGMAGVFSTPQWGGRAYKVARPGGPRGEDGSKGKILAFMAPNKAATAIEVSFKIPLDDAQSACERHDWIQPHSFRTLAPAGWLTATVATKRQVGTLTGLLNQSHALHDLRPVESSTAPPARPATDEETGHIDRVMGKARDDGWQPQSDW